jgi:hypothetical protein
MMALVLGSIRAMTGKTRSGVRQPVTLNSTGVVDWLVL